MKPRELQGGEEVKYPTVDLVYDGNTTRTTNLI